MTRAGKAGPPAGGTRAPTRPFAGKQRSSGDWKWGGVAAKLKDHGSNLTNGSQSPCLCHAQALLIRDAPAAVSLPFPLGYAPDTPSSMESSRQELRFFLPGLRAVSWSMDSTLHLNARPGPSSADGPTLLTGGEGPWTVLLKTKSGSTAAFVSISGGRSRNRSDARLAAGCCGQVGRRSPQPVAATNPCCWDRLNRHSLSWLCEPAIRCHGASTFSSSLQEAPQAPDVLDLTVLRFHDRLPAGFAG